MRCIAVILLSLLPWLPAVGQDVNFRTESHLRPVDGLGWGQAVDYSPVAFAYSRLGNLSTAEVRGDWRADDETLLPQVGSGLSQGEFRAESLLRLREGAALQGGVSYQRGVRRGVNYNESSDFGLLYPYVIADTVGGDMQREQYSFHGRYAGEAGRLTYALEGSFRALHEYRTVDPRPRNVTSDFTAKASAGYSFPRRRACLTGAFRKYHQASEIEFLRTAGAVSTVFHLTGLGSDYARFEGTSTYNDSRFIGYGGSLSALTLPGEDGKPFLAGVKYDILTLTQHLSNLNDAPITELLTQALTGFASRTWEGRAVDWGVEATASYTLKQGDENVLDNAADGSFNELASLTMYRSHDVDARLSGALSLDGWGGTLSLRPRLGYGLFRAEHLYPERTFSVMSASAGIGGDWLRRSGDWLTCLAADLGYEMNLDGELSLPDDYTDSRLLAAYSAIYGWVAGDVATVSLSALVQRRVNASFAAYVRLSGARRLISGGNGVTALSASVGVAF